MFLGRLAEESSLPADSGSNSWRHTKANRASTLFWGSEFSVFADRSFSPGDHPWAGLSSRNQPLFDAVQTNRSSIPIHSPPCHKDRSHWRERRQPERSAQSRRASGSAREILLARCWPSSGRQAQIHCPRNRLLLPGLRARRIPTRLHSVFLFQSNVHKLQCLQTLRGQRDGLHVLRENSPDLPGGASPLRAANPTSCSDCEDQPGETAA